MYYKIIGHSIFGTRRMTDDGRAFDSEFLSTDPNDYILGTSYAKAGSLVVSLMEHYKAAPECEIQTEYGSIEAYQTPVHNGLIVSRCTYDDGVYAYSPLFTNTVSPLAIVNFFIGERKRIDYLASPKANKAIIKYVVLLDDDRFAPTHTYAASPNKFDRFSDAVNFAQKNPRSLIFECELTADTGELLSMREKQASRRKCKKSVARNIDRLTKIDDDIFFGHKMIIRGEATEVELRNQFAKLEAEKSQIEKELKKEKTP